RRTENHDELSLAVGLELQERSELWEAARGGEWRGAGAAGVAPAVYRECAGAPGGLAFHAWFRATFCGSPLRIENGDTAGIQGAAACDRYVLPGILPACGRSDFGSDGILGC